MYRDIMIRLIRLEDDLEQGRLVATSRSVFILIFDLVKFVQLIFAEPPFIITGQASGLQGG